MTLGNNQVNFISADRQKAAVKVVKQGLAMVAVSGAVLYLLLPDIITAHRAVFIVVGQGDISEVHHVIIFLILGPVAFLLVVLGLKVGRRKIVFLDVSEVVFARILTSIV